MHIFFGSYGQDFFWEFFVRLFLIFFEWMDCCYCFLGTIAKRTLKDNDDNDNGCTVYPFFVIC